MTTASAPFILSVSRRTDVPGFYGEWFLRRLAEGRAEYVHPYTRARVEVPLEPDRVAAIVFWTKNFGPLLPRVDDLTALGYPRWLVHYTITGLGPVWEPRAPAWADAVDTLQRLSDRIGPERIYWRFDPMVFTERTAVGAGLRPAPTGNSGPTSISIVKQRRNIFYWLGREPGRREKFRERSRWWKKGVFFLASLRLGVLGSWRPSVRTLMARSGLKP